MKEERPKPWGVPRSYSDTRGGPGYQQAQEVNPRRCMRGEPRTPSGLCPEPQPGRPRQAQHASGGQGGELSR